MHHRKLSKSIVSSDYLWGSNYGEFLLSITSTIQFFKKNINALYL